MINPKDKGCEPRRVPHGNGEDVQLSLFDANSATKKTRAIACAAAMAKGPSRRELCFEYALRQGTHGCTGDEIGLALDIPSQSMPAIIGALRAAGRLIPTNRTRLTRLGKPAVVYVARGFESRANTATNEGSV
jgi:hypothetical protein